MATGVAPDLIGRTTILNHEPRRATYRELLYVPTGRAKRDEGLFDRGQRLIADAGYFRNHPDRISLYPAVNPLPHGRFAYAPNDMRYVFVGALTGHYGHFITGSLARLWALDMVDRRDTKLVILNHGPVATPLAIPWLRDILSAFDVRADDLVNFARPTRFGEMIVPAPAFEEGNFAHTAFGWACGAAGRRLTGPARPSGRPVFLTKMHLSSGVSRVNNEDALCRCLHDAGFDIVAPERLPVADQVRLFMERPIVAGMAGSAMHTAIFAPGRLKFELRTEPRQLSNQALLDGANGGRTRSLHPGDGIRREEAEPGFPSVYRLLDPRRTAEQLLKAIEAESPCRSTGIG